jgi:hypothetical protein
MRWIFLLAVVLCGCASKEDAGAPPFPQRAGAWTLAEPPRATQPVAGARRAWEARYRGQPEIRVVLAEMRAQASAFEAVQKRRPSAGQLTFYRGRYFGVAESPGAAQPALNRFVNAFQDAMPQ